MFLFCENGTHITFYKFFFFIFKRNQRGADETITIFNYPNWLTEDNMEVQKLCCNNIVKNNYDNQCVQVIISVHSVLWLSPPPQWTTAVEHCHSRLAWSSHWQSPPPPGCSTHSYTQCTHTQNAAHHLANDLWHTEKRTLWMSMTAMENLWSNSFWLVLYMLLARPSIFGGTD